MHAALSLLERIDESHRRMMVLADALDWERLGDEWRRIHPEIVELQRQELNLLDGSERAQAAKRITGLIDFEKRISARITPWMEQTRPLIEIFRKYPLLKSD